jgi:hypothetical protein
LTEFYLPKFEGRPGKAAFDEERNDAFAAERRTPIFLGRNAVPL